MGVVNSSGAIYSLERSLKGLSDEVKLSQTALVDLWTTFIRNNREVEIYSTQLFSNEFSLASQEH